MKLLFSIITLSLISTLPLLAQENTDTSNLKREDAVNIYIDCDYCDLTYFRENFPLVNYVRDRKFADVHIIMSEMETGSGGTEYMIQFTGQNRFQQLSDTLIFSLQADYTDDEEREAQLKHIQLGLVPYILKTPFADKLSLSIDHEKENIQEQDPWKNWVFSIRGSGFANGEQSYQNFNFYSRLSAQKVSPEVKIEINMGSSYDESRYRLYEDDSLVYAVDIFQRSYFSYNLFTKSFGEHWGAGGFLNFRNSTYGNLDFRWSVRPAIEYNVFKYSEASRKQLRFLYSVGFDGMNYSDPTIYDKLDEQLFSQNLSVILKFIVKWGAIDASLYGSNYLHDFSLFHVGTSMGGEVRITKGLSANLMGSLDLPRDQITLRKGDISTEDVLTRQHELATDYNFWMNIGLTYTFGSIYNNVVNPRFDDGF